MGRAFWGATITPAECYERSHTMEQLEGSFPGKICKLDSWLTLAPFPGLSQMGVSYLDPAFPGFTFSTTILVPTGPNPPP